MLNNQLNELNDDTCEIAFNMLDGIVDIFM